MQERSDKGVRGIVIHFVILIDLFLIQSANSP